MINFCLFSRNNLKMKLAKFSFPNYWRQKVKKFAKDSCPEGIDYQLCLVKTNLIVDICFVLFASLSVLRISLRLTIQLS